MKTKKGFFYGWVIVIACFIMQAIPFGVSQNIQPQFIGYVVEGEGFTLTQFSLLFTIGTIVSAVASPFIGRLFDKKSINLKWFYTFGAILSGVGFLLFGYSHHLWQYYGVGAIVQVGTSIISSIGIPVLITMWFQDKAGTALGIAFAGGGIGNVILQQLAAYLLVSKGYAYSYIIFGLLSLVVGIPISLFLVRRPKENELKVYLQAKQVDQSIPYQEVKTWGYTLSMLKKNVFFWLFGLGFALVGIYVSGMFVQYMAYFKTLQFSATMIGNIGSVFAIFTIVGNLCGGWLFDKVGVKNCLYLAALLIISCGLCLLFASTLPILGYVFAIFLGIAVFAYVIGPSYLTGFLFGNRSYGAILGVINIFFAIGYALGAVVFGVIVDVSGGYTLAWIFMTIIGGLSYILLILATTHFLKAKNKQVIQ